MELAQIVPSAISIAAVVIAIITLILNRGDKGDGRYNELSKELKEVALQISSLRTELAQQELTRHRELEARFVSRREWDVQAEAWDFAQRLNVEIHRRLWPDAAIHEPGGMRER
jgi:hypothetical protein